MENQLNFYNTIGFTGKTLSRALINIDKQGERILIILKQSRKALTPFEVLETYCDYYPEIPITSIRRAMTDLTNDGKLVKLSEMKQGNYGKPNHKWRAV